MLSERLYRAQIFPGDKQRSREKPISFQLGHELKIDGRTREFFAKMTRNASRRRTEAERREQLSVEFVSQGTDPSLVRASSFLFTLKASGGLVSETTTSSILFNVPPLSNEALNEVCFSHTANLRSAQSTLSILKRPDICSRVSFEHPEALMLSRRTRRQTAAARANEAASRCLSLKGHAFSR